MTTAMPYTELTNEEATMPLDKFLARLTVDGVSDEARERVQEALKLGALVRIRRAIGRGLPLYHTGRLEEVL